MPGLSLPSPVSPARIPMTGLSNRAPGGRPPSTVSGPVGCLPGCMEDPGDAINGGHFSLRFHGFPARMTMFREKMTLLYEETSVSVSDSCESAVCRPGNGGLQHYYNRGSDGA